jgi:hypothetical protein
VQKRLSERPGSLFFLNKNVNILLGTLIQTGKDPLNRKNGKQAKKQYRKEALAQAKTAGTKNKLLRLPSYQTHSAHESIT